MRWYSTVESANNLEFSLLATIESIAAVSVSLWLAWKFQTATHILIASAIAPFLLLRTEKSTERGLRYFVWIWDKYASSIWIQLAGKIILIAIAFIIGLAIEPDTRIIIITFALLVTIGGIIEVEIEEKRNGVELALLVEGSILSKLLATALTFINAPLYSLHNIPINWLRVVFCIDTLYPPELLPNIERTQSILEFKTWTNHFINKLRSGHWKNKIEGAILILLTPFVFLPALTYRWSLKSSSIIWLPLLWIIGWQQKTGEDANRQLQSELEWMRYSAWAKLMVAVSFFAIIFQTLLPLILKDQFTHLKATLNPNTTNLMLDNLIDYFLATQMQAWHWSRLVAALLTLFLFFYAEKLLYQRKHIPDAGLDFAPSFIHFITRVRTPLSLFTIGCGLYLLISPIDWHEQWQNMHWLPFDWDWHKLLG